MAAISTDITAAKRKAIIVSASDSALLTRFPNARDGQTAPREGFFDSESDAAAALAARFALIGAVRRRFVVQVADMLLPDFSAGVPCYRLTDAEQGVDAVFLAARSEVDLENETMRLELFG